MWDTVIAPAPTANTAKALSVRDNNPKVSNKGAIMAEAVMMATVEEPCAVFSTAAITKAINKPPTPILDSKLMMEAMSTVRSMAPKAPPAPVINTIAPAYLKASATHSSFSFDGVFLPNEKAKNTPMSKAITGLPKKSTT